MNIINFSNTYIQDYQTGWIMFKAYINNIEITCEVSQEFLQGIDPLNKNTFPLKQFENNKNTIHKIATHLISINTEYKNIEITTQQLKSNLN